ncbi:helix-turn-helix domain-containing protein [Methanococcus maripaludis]|uniref:Putative transcriptional regulator n=1 Tax=Methanococcus maripaludis TaxID=39152 RepID=A0A8T4H309_METMI|nr:helix-turn-helix domain-containing protein [Methanococcus maripaludis]MBM7409772.1 putative transcriptional regulator [Methanococcus maripaludis]MBP2219102.1 putative transcriptional regulator [Methanococcus maripaludis]
MEAILKKLVNTKERKLILTKLLKEPGCCEDLSKELNISKGLPAQFLKLCTSLNLVKRERISHKVYYSINPENYLKIYNAVTIEDKKTEEKKNLKHSLKKDEFQTTLSVENTLKDYDIKKIDNGFGGTTFILNDNDSSFEIFKTNENNYWCVACQSNDCDHVLYLKKASSKKRN